MSQIQALLLQNPLRIHNRHLQTKLLIQNQITALGYNAHVADASFTLQTNAVSSPL